MYVSIFFFFLLFYPAFLIYNNLLVYTHGLKHANFFTFSISILAFMIMIVLTCVRLGKGEGRGHPEVAIASGAPNLFGVCVYSFMCHHSLPSMVTPIRNKSKLYAVLLGDYGTILVFYLVLR